jgi:TolA-binding protein
LAPAAWKSAFFAVVISCPAFALPSASLTESDLEEAGLPWSAAIKTVGSAVLSAPDAVASEAGVRPASPDALASEAGVRPASPDAGAGDARMTLLIGGLRLRLGRDAGAAPYLANWLAAEPLSPDRPRASLALGIALLGNNEPVRALRFLAGSRQARPGYALDDDLLLWEGEASWRLDDFAGADRSFRELATKYPESPYRGQALYRLGWAESRQGAAESAVVHFAEAGMADSAILPAADLMRGWTLLQLGKGAEAKELFTAVERGKFSSRYTQESVIGQAECAYRSGDFTGASALYDRALGEASGGPARAAIRYSLAWTALKQKQYDRARGMFLGLEKDFPQDPVAPFAAYRAALCLLDLGKASEALLELKGIQARYPGHEVGEWSVYSRGWIYLSLAKYNDAKAAFRELLDRYPKGRLVAPAKYLTGAALYQERHFREAEREYLAFVSTHAESGMADGALLWAGWAALLDGRPSDALKHLAALAQDYPKTQWKADADIGGGEAAFALKDYPRAVKSYESAAKASGEPRLKALIGLGWCAFATADWKEAERNFRAVLAEAGNLPGAAAGKMKSGARLRLGDALFNQKRYADAEPQYRASLTGEDEAQARWSQLQLGWCAFRSDRPDEARSRWDQLRRRWPQSPEAAMALQASAETLFQQEKFPEAETAFRLLAKETQATEAMAENASLRIGDCLYNNKSFEAAVLAYRDFAARYPKSGRMSEALFGMQWAYLQLGEFEQARREAVSFLAKYPSTSLAAEVKLMVAESFRREKKPKEALDQYRELLEQYPTSDLGPAVRIKVGETQEELGAYQEAAASYTDFIARYPTHPLAKEAGFRLGVVKYASGDAPGAVELFYRIADDPTDPHAADALYNVILCRKKQADEEGMAWAMKKLETGYPATRAAAQGRLVMAYYLTDKGRKPEAITYLTTVAGNAFPDLAAESSYALGELHGGQGEAEKALIAFQAGAELLPKGGDWAVQCAFAAAGTYAAQGRNDDAIAVLRKVLESDGVQADAGATACFGIGQRYEAMGKPTEATLMYQECVKRNPPADLKGQAEKRIAALKTGAGKGAKPGASVKPKTPKKTRQVSTGSASGAKTKAAPAKKPAPAKKKAKPRG